MSYRIGDEPQPGRLAQVAVNPVWPLLAVMFGGAGLSWPWFALNSLALGSPHRRQELAWVVGGFAGNVALLLLILSLANAGILAGLGLSYAVIVLTVWKLAVSYWLYTLQGRSFGLYRYFGGPVRNGALIVFAALFLRSGVLASLPFFWKVVLG